MAQLVKHLKQSIIADGPDPNQVNPSDWNASHVFSGGALGSLLMRDTGDATYGASWLASVAAGGLLMSTGVGAPPTWLADVAAGSVLISNGVGALPTWASSLTLNGSLAVNGNVSVGGLLTVSGIGTHAFSVAGPGSQVVQISNFGNTPTSAAALQLGNNTTGAITTLQVFASGFTTSGLNIADSTLLAANGANGLTIAVGAVAGIMRFATSNTERLRIDQTGFVAINAAQNYVNARAGIAYDSTHGLMLHHTAAAGGLNYVMFVNAANAVMGTISQPTETSVAYNTTSDARLKTDRGRAVDLSALRGVVVHDFTWTADGIADRGVFAQEAHDLYPRAVTKGTDERTDDGQLTRPWMTDYSKLVPDLIAGWQHHDAELAALRALLATVKG